MSDPMKLVSESFRAFRDEAPEHAEAWMSAVQGLDRASALDDKTKHLAYLAVLAALGRESGISFHVHLARQVGASREEIISAILVGLPAAGHVVTQSLPSAIAQLDSE
jgi:AhpD family alkylhydroperoxidase